MGSKHDDIAHLVANAMLNALNDRAFSEDGSIACPGYFIDDLTMVTGRFYLVSIAKHVLEVMADAELVEKPHFSPMPPPR
jgi:hypothetical protein